MRIDHHAYQRATRIAGVGFMVQLGIGLTTLVLSRAQEDTTLMFGAVYVLIGLLPWVGLIVLFNQQKLERLEALEQDELAAASAADSVFTEDDEEMRVAARRLRKMYQWVLPAFSLVIAVLLASIAWAFWRHLSAIAAGEAEFHHTPLIGWAVAICLAFTVVSFIFSRFVAGMAKLESWQNLRGGAAFMVGNSLVMLAVSIGMGFRFFTNVDVIEAMAWAIFIFMFVQAAEIVLNFVLNLYRPRIPGEAPRPAFDSKLLSMLAAPDNLVRSINEAVNYQFGFDITSSWGYQLFIRSISWLVIGGLGVTMLLNMIVIVEPQEQAVKLSAGRLISDEPHGSGVMLKLPWPFQSAEVYDISRVRSLHLTGKRVVEKGVHMFTDELGKSYDTELDPFIVGASRLDEGKRGGGGSSSATGLDGDVVSMQDSDTDLPAGELVVDSGVSRAVSLVDCEIAVQYRIRADGGLIDYLLFASDDVPRRRNLSYREQALRGLALRETTQYLARLTVDEVLAQRRSTLANELASRIQVALDTAETGVEVLAVDFLMIRPAAEAASAFEEFSVAWQNGRTAETQARQRLNSGFTQAFGDVARAEAIIAEVERYETMSRDRGLDDPEVVAQRLDIEAMLVDSRGFAGQIIEGAERNRWVTVMSARAQAQRIAGQVAPFRAAPTLYKQREVMDVLKRVLPGMSVTVVGIPYDRLDIDMELTDLDPLLQISDALRDPNEPDL